MFPSWRRKKLKLRRIDNLLYSCALYKYAPAAFRKNLSLVTFSFLLSGKGFYHAKEGVERFLGIDVFSNENVSNKISK